MPGADDTSQRLKEEDRGKRKRRIGAWCARNVLSKKRVILENIEQGRGKVPTLPKDEGQAT